MEPQIAPEVAQKRLDELMGLQSEISRQNNERYLNQEIEVLNEGRKNFNSPYYKGRGWMHAPDDIDGHVYFRADREVEAGEFVKVRITRVEEYDLYGELV